jgi:hypothetical protein
MSRAPARKSAPARRRPPPAGPRSHVRNASAGDVVRRASRGARSYARRHAPRQTNPLTRENLTDAAASIVGGVGTAIAGGLLADKFDPRWSNSIGAVGAGVLSMFTERGGWRTLLQSAASASAGQAALALLADDEPPAPPKEVDRDAKGTAAPKAGAKPATPSGAKPGKRNAMPSSAMDRAFARSEARIAQVLADDGVDG